MKISENWLREWANPPVDATALAEKLNLAGLECEAEPLTIDPPRGVVVARILKAERILRLIACRCVKSTLVAALA